MNTIFRTVLLATGILLSTGADQVQAQEEKEAGKPSAKTEQVTASIGSGSPGLIVLPKIFMHDDDDETTIFIMPRKNDLEGPVSMRVSTLRDMKDLDPSPKLIKMFLGDGEDGKKVTEKKGRYTVTEEREMKDEQGILWHLRHFSVFADNLLFTVTVATIKGREKEAQCKELSNALPAILDSLKRAPAKLLKKEKGKKGKPQSNGGEE